LCIRQIIREGIRPIIREGIQPIISQGIQPIISQGIQPIISQGIQPIISQGIQPIIFLLIGIHHNGAVYLISYYFLYFVKSNKEQINSSDHSIYVLTIIRLTVNT